MEPTSLASLLQSYGGWGLSAILIIVVWRMAGYIIQLHRESKEETKVYVTALVETRETLRAFKGAMETLDRKLEKADDRSGG